MMSKPACLQSNDAYLGTEYEKCQQRIDQRRRVFAELDEVNRHIGNITSEDIYEICEASKQERGERFDIFELKYSR